MTDKNFAPLVSVIIPCYNVERYVESAVRSITDGRSVQFGMDQRS